MPCVEGNVADEKSKHQLSRREFVKKAAYIAPAIVTLQAAPMYARAGSVKNGNGRGNGNGNGNSNGNSNGNGKKK